MDAAADKVANALRDYMRLVAHLQRVANPEDWATYGDWARLQAQGMQALAEFDAGKPRAFVPFCDR